MRITAGKLKGHSLKIPKIRDLRPTQESVREAIFNILGDLVVGKKVVDLYAGSGSLGLEALSHGAREAIFVEVNAHGCQTIRENLTPPQVKEKGMIICRDAKSFLLQSQERDWEVVFLDPPYALGRLQDVFLALVPHLRVGAVVVYEHAKLTECPPIPGLRVIDRRIYGTTKVTFLTREAGKVGN